RVRHMVSQRLCGNGPPAAWHGRRHLPLAEAAQVERPTCLWAGARKPFAAKGLRADYRADLIAIDVDVADMDAVDDMLHPRVDACVQAECQAVTLGVDIGD